MYIYFKTIRCSCCGNYCFGKQGVAASLPVCNNFVISTYCFANSKVNTTFIERFIQFLDCLQTCIKGTLNAACDACTCDNHILTGRVQTKDGAPISEAKIALSETPYKVLAQTDDKGFFKALNVCTDAKQEFVISRDGFVPVKLKATVSSSTAANVKVQLEDAGIQLTYSFVSCRFNSRNN